ncbi:hypothetical protein [Dactylosporangium maewongense]
MLTQSMDWAVASRHSRLPPPVDDLLRARTRERTALRREWSGGPSVNPG